MEDDTKSRVSRTVTRDHREHVRAGAGAHTRGDISHNGKTRVTRRDGVTLELRDQGGDEPSEIRLRRALKCLLRSFGFRCTSISTTDAKSASDCEVF